MKWLNAIQSCISSTLPAAVHFIDPRYYEYENKIDFMKGVSGFLLKYGHKIRCIITQIQ